MRRWPIAAAVAGLALALAGVAFAATTFTQHSNIYLTGADGNQPTGISALVYSTVTPTGSAPWSAKKLTVTFPKNTKFNLGSVKPCTLSGSQISSGKSCPAASKVGSGTVGAVAVSGNKTVTSVTGTVVAYVAGANKMIQVVKASGQTIVIPVTTSGNVLSISIPTVKVAGFDVVLTKLQLTVPKRGSGSKTLVKAGQCTKNQWVTKTHFVYTNGKTKDITYKGGFCS